MSEANQKTITRAAVFPAASVERHPLSDVEPTWADFNQAMHAAWRESTFLANWSIRQLIAADCQRTPEVASYGDLPFEQPYLYGLFKRGAKDVRLPNGAVLRPFPRRDFWANATNSANAVIQAATDRYRALRYAIVWKQDTNPPTFKYPFPFSVPSKSWEPVWIDNGNHQVPGVRVNFPIPTQQKGESWKDYQARCRRGSFTIRLRSGPDFVRQLIRFNQLMDGSAKKCALAIYRQRIIGDPHRQAGEEKKQCYNIMVKLVGKFPARETPKGGRAILVRTLPDSLMEAVVETGPRVALPKTASEIWLWALSEQRRWKQVWVNNSDDIRRLHARLILEWKSRHESTLDRLRQDRKYERRCSGKRRRLDDATSPRALKMQRRLKSFIEMTVAHLMNFCQRQGVSDLIYDDREHGWCPKFPWYQLAIQVASKCQEFGIRLVGRKSEDEDDNECSSPEVPNSPNGESEWQKASTAAETERAIRRATSRPRARTSSAKRPAARRT